MPVNEAPHGADLFPTSGGVPSSADDDSRGDTDSALARWAGRLSEATDELPAWLDAARRLAGTDPDRWARRRARVAVVGSHTTGHLATLLPVAAARHDVAIETYETPFGQYEPEILDPDSGLYRFAPDLVFLLIDERELRLPAVSPDPAADLAAEVARWRSLWAGLRERTGATVVQLGFVPRADDGLGHLALTTHGSRRRLVRALNLELGDAAAADGVRLVDTETLRAQIGSTRWDDDRYWFLARQAIGLGAVPAVCRELARVMAAVLGLTRKVIVVDLDNTLWGGVIGEDGLGGIALGGDARGEAHQAFQEQLQARRRLGALLAVVSKNNDADARQPFTDHPDMRLGLDDFVAFRAGWQDKPEVIREIAAELSLGLDSFVFLDDSPFEREAVRRALPEVDVVELPSDPAGYAAALSRHPTLEPGHLSAEDGARTGQYQARARTARARAAAASPEDFLVGLGMEAEFAPVTADTLPRVVQLVAKTNQFTLTGARPGEAAVRELTGREGAVHLTLRLRDRFTDHGLVGVVLAVPEHPGAGDLHVHTWLMSCRVLGRGAEIATMTELTDRARRSGYARVVGTHVDTGRNEPAREAYRRCGFTQVDTGGAATTAAAAGAGAGAGAAAVATPTAVATSTAGARRGAGVGTSVWVFDLVRDRVPDPGHIAVLNSAVLNSAVTNPAVTNREVVR